MIGGNGAAPRSTHKVLTVLILLTAMITPLSSATMANSSLNQQETSPKLDQPSHVTKIPDSAPSSLNWTYSTGYIINPRTNRIMSRDGSVIVVGCDGTRTIYAFNKSSNSTLWTYNTTLAYVPGIAVSGDGKYVAAVAKPSGGTPFTATLYLFKTSGSGTPIWTYSTSGSGYDVAEDSVDISTNGTYIAATLCGTLYVFRNSSSTPLWSHALGDTSNVAMSKDGKYIFVGTGVYVQKYYLFLRTSSTPLWASAAEGTWARMVAISDDGSYMVGGDNHGYVHFFSKGSGTPLWSYYDGGSIIWTVSISSGGGTIAAGSDAGRVYVFDKSSNTPLWTHSTGSAVTCTMVSPDGSCIMAGASSGMVYLFAKANSTPAWTISAGGSGYLAVALANGAAQVAFGGDRLHFTEGACISNVLIEVPYDYQYDASWCALASLAMVLRYYGKNVHCWDIAGDWWWWRYRFDWNPGIPKNQGVWLSQLAAYMSHEYQQQFEVKVGNYPYFTDQIWRDIESNVTAGYPVVIATFNATQLHAVVVVGFNATGLFVNDPSGFLVSKVLNLTPYVNLQPFIDVYVPKAVLQNHVVVGGLPFVEDSSILLIKGSPSPIPATLSINSRYSVDCYDKSDMSSEVFVDLDHGLTWKSCNHAEVWDAKDILAVQANVYNAKNLAQDFTVEFQIVDVTPLIGGTTYTIYTHNYTVPSRSCRSVDIQKVDLNTLLQEGRIYEVVLSLRDLNNKLIDRITTPRNMYFNVGSLIEFHETFGKLYAQVYDSAGNHVGVNYATNGTEIQIPGAWYYDDLNGTVTICLPPNLTSFRVVVDGRRAEQTKENYTLIADYIRDGNVTGESQVTGTIGQGESQTFDIKIDPATGTITITAANTSADYTFLVVLGGAFAAGVAALVLGTVVYRRRVKSAPKKVPQVKKRVEREEVAGLVSKPAEEKPIVREILICPYCGTKNDPSTGFCRNCGANLER